MTRSACADELRALLRPHTACACEDPCRTDRTIVARSTHDCHIAIGRKGDRAALIRSTHSACADELGSNLQVLCVRKLMRGEEQSNEQKNFHRFRETPSQPSSKRGKSRKRTVRVNHNSSMIIDESRELSNH